MRRKERTNTYRGEENKKRIRKNKKEIRKTREGDRERSKIKQGGLNNEERGGQKEEVDNNVNP